MDLLALIVQYRVPLAIGIGVLGAVLLFGADSIGPWLKTAWERFRKPATPPAEDTDVLDLLAAKRLQARFERVSCPEGKAAVQVCLSHFFHGGAA